ncbi:MAG: hypothetical protein DI534_06170 [Leifsonia xyli]|nr:MAG: hypothetical protein DI534_06170 [Leifsonia xyli]
MTAVSPRAERRTVVRSGLAGLIAGSLMWAALTAAGVTIPAAPANAAASSAVTVTAAEQDKDLANAPMPDLAVTVSQTSNLVAQGIRVSWKGGKKSTTPSSGNGGTNFLQIFMCWGDDPTDPTRPDRTTCQYGGANTPGATRDAFRNMTIDEIPEEDQPYSALTAVSFLPPFTGIPFVGRDGKRVDGIKTDPVTKAKTIDETVNLNANQYFTAYSTNEIPWAGSGDNGTGAVSFEVQTAAQSSGLGCGNAVVQGNVTTGASCWLVILPRGVSDNGASTITQSGLFIDSWRHALSVKLGFEPIGNRCPQGAAERQLAGSELVSLAVNSWQPAVCNQSGASVYSLLTMSESDATSAAATAQGAPLALTSYPLKTEGTDPLQYAPIALTGVTIAVAIDRRPDPFKDLPADYLDAARTPFTKVNLTPRLLAKLLTGSYRSSLPNGADTSHLPAANPDTVTKDKEFLAINDPEWAAQDLSGPAIADVMVPQGRSDAARAVWAYIASDPDARDFMASKPDSNGMVVNPWYSTDASKNPSGSAFSLDRDDFPKADPVEVTPPNTGPVNMVTWRPYSNDLGTVAYLTLRGDGQTLGLWDPYSFPPKYGKGSRMLPGGQAVLGLTDTAAAARYQVVTASMRNPAGVFVAPSKAGMLAAAAAMTGVNAAGRVVGFVPVTPAAKAATDAYPLTLPVYAAANPAESDAALRTGYAAFIRYAVSTAGQTLGTEVGQLPEGYAPIPAAWATAANAAAATIAAGGTGTTNPPASQPSSSNSGSGGFSNSGTPEASGEAPQPDPSGSASPLLSSSVTPADPQSATGGVVIASLLAGIVGAIISLVASRRRAIRTWARR